MKHRSAITDRSNHTHRLQTGATRLHRLQTGATRLHRLQTGATQFGATQFWATTLVVVLLAWVQPAMGWQEVPATDPAPASDPAATPPDPVSSGSDEGGETLALPTQSARALVEEGNRRFHAGEFDTALESYDGAKAQRPDSLEVDFDRGLSAFSLGQLDEARNAFERVTLSPDTDLAENAMYGIAACDHADALALAEQNPQEAVAKLEQAMRRYHDVLSANPDHRLARDANYRAAMKWRRIKEMIQEQQPQQGNEDKDESQDQQEQQDQERQQGEQDQQQKNEDRDGEPKESDDSQQDQDPQDQEPSDDQQEQDPQRSDPQQDEEKKSAEPAEAKEDPSRDQAARELRRLMDQMRERKQERRQPIREASAPPLEKDW